MVVVNLHGLLQDDLYIHTHTLGIYDFSWSGRFGLSRLVKSSIRWKLL